MIDRTTGDITFDSGDRIGPSTDLTTFRASPLGRAQPAGHEDYTNFSLGTCAIAGLAFAVTSYFHQTQLTMVLLTLVEPDDGRSWDDWSESKELVRKKKHDAFLAAQLGPPPWAYGWGRIESTYDARGGSSLITFVYA